MRGRAEGEHVPGVAEAEDLGRIGVLHVLVQGVRIELREHEGALEVRVDDVCHREVDETIGRGELERSAGF